MEKKTNLKLTVNFSARTCQLVMTKHHEILLFAHREELYLESRRKAARIQSFHQDFIMGLTRDVSI